MKHMRHSKTMSSNLFAALCAVLSVADASMPWEPEPNGDANSWWIQKHQQLLQQTHQYKNSIRAVFIGASVTEYWLSEGRPIWDNYYAKRNAANYGIGGDSTSNVLWRLQNKELDGLNPKVIVFSCGPG